MQGTRREAQGTEVFPFLALSQLETVTVCVPCIPGVHRHNPYSRRYCGVVDTSLSS